MTPPVVIPKRSRRELVLALVLGGAALAGIGFGFFGLSRSTEGGWRTGTIVAKHREELPDATQVNIGPGGSAARNIPQGYLLEVRPRGSEKTYFVPVEPAVWEKAAPGESFRFILPPAQ
jgi:hypothetical protein